MKRQWQAAQGLPQIPSLFLQHSKLEPDALCIHTLGGQSPPLTYGEVAAKAGRACRSLRARGVRRGDIIGVCVSEGWEMVVVQLAVLLARAAFAPIDLSLPTKRVSAMLTQAALSAALSPHPPADQDSLPNLEHLRPSCVVIADDCCHDTEIASAIAGVEGIYPPTVLSTKDLFKGGAGEGEGHEGWGGDDDDGGPEAEGASGMSEEEEGGGKCWVYFTSGTSGVPKGVICSHQAAANYCLQHPLLPLATKRGQSVRLLLASSFTFDPSAGDTFAAIAYGCVLCVAAKRASLLGDIAGAVVSGRATHVCTTPALWGGVRWREGMECLEVVGLGGEKMGGRTVEEWGGRVRLVNIWGTTEGTVYQTAFTVRDARDTGLIGDAMEGVVMRLEREDGEEVQDGEEGEIVIGGVQIALGYLGGMQGGFESREGARWYRTGDLAVREGGGGMRLLGRKDAQVKVNGERVELEEVETVLSRCHLVQAAAARPSLGGKSLDAYLLLTEAGTHNQHTAVTAAMLQARGALSRSWCPVTYTVVEGALPKTASGKLDRTALPKPAGAGGEAGGQLEGVELMVAQVWGEVLGVDAGVIARKSDFASLGGDSLLALAVSKRMLALQAERAGGGGEWPVDGVVVGPLGARHVLDATVLKEYADHLVRSRAFEGGGAGEEGRAGEEGAGREEGLDEGRARGRDEGGDGGWGSQDATPPAWMMRGVRALYSEASAGGADGVRALVGAGVPVEGVGGKHGWTRPLHAAAKAGNVGSASALLDLGAKVTSTSPAKTTPAHLASASASSEVLSLLLLGGAPVRSRDANRQTLLHYASRAGAANCAKVLLEAGAREDVAATDKWNRTPLHWAVLNGHASCVALLLASGAPAVPPQVPERVHKRRTSLVAESPIGIAKRRVEDGEPGSEEVLRLLLDAAGRAGE